MARNKTTTTRTDGTKNRTHNLISHILRIFQFLSALTSLILFSVRLAKIIRLTNNASKSNGAVEGILAAAVLYTIIATILQCTIKAGASQIVRIILIIFDILFVAAFIVVAVLTSPKRNGSSGPCNTKSAQFIGTYAPSTVNCNLPWGTFILAIFSTVLHAITTAYHAVQHRRKQRKHENVIEKDMDHNAAHHNGANGANGTNDGYGRNGL